jgi:general secretion pathway protein G
MALVQRSIRDGGFTLVELLISLVVLSILATMVVPVAELTVTRSKEYELRTSLRQIRDAIDAYRLAVDEQRIRRLADQSGYPPNLQILVEGVVDQKDVAGQKIYFLRRIPRDPMHPDDGVPPEQTWGKRSYRSSHDAPREGDDVYDVYSKSAGRGLNDIPYREW